MTSLDILSFKANIEQFIETQNLPKEVVRMVLSEILNKVTRDALDEAMKEAKEKETENGNNS